MTSTVDAPDGYLVVVKRDCETCVEIAPALREIGATKTLTAVSQDDPGFPEGLTVTHDRDLDISWTLETQVTPTLYRVTNRGATEVAVGWKRAEWRQVLDMPQLGAELPEFRPGCGSVTMEPDVHARLTARHSGAPAFDSRLIELGDGEDEHEAMYARGWSDGLPLVPPTPDRVMSMLVGTTRPADEVVAVVPPNYVPATVESVAVNAVMAGCLPQYLPVVLAATEAICTDEFNIHGVSATTFFSGVVIVVNGQITNRIGMNAEFNVFGPGNRANATIGRAVNLVVRNLGGAVPGGVDRAAQGHPAKWTLCFAEREHDSPWSSLAAERGIPDGNDAVTVYAGQGPTPVVDQQSRTADSLARSFAACLQTEFHPKLVQVMDALVAVSPEHVRVFADAGWDKARLRDELMALTSIPKAELVRGGGGVSEGMPPSFLESAPDPVPKFRDDGLLFVRAGSGAGMFSGIISSWMARNSRPVTVPISD